VGALKICCEPVPSKKEIPLPGALGLPSSMLRKRDGLPALFSKT
jgi:hypothetical protein